MFNILLQVLDDGRLTDGQGRTVDFRNVILILTSNLGSQYLIDTSKPFPERAAEVMEVVRASFKARVPQSSRRHRDVRTSE